MDFGVRGQKGMDFFTGGNFMDCYFGQKWQFKVKKDIIKKKKKGFDY